MAGLADPVQINGQFSKKALFGISQIGGHPASDLFGLTLPGLFRPPRSQFVLLPVYPDHEEEKQESRQEDGACEKKELLEVPAVGPLKGGGSHAVMVTLSLGNMSWNCKDRPR